MGLFKIIPYLFFIFSSLYAKGILAGTLIQGQAMISYDLNGKIYQKASNIDSFVVDQIIDIKLAWQDTNAIDVAAGERQRVLTFILKNEGNGIDTINLEYEHNSSSDFTPTNVNIFEDSNKNGIFDNNDKKINQTTLQADQSTTLFLVADIPNKEYKANEKSYDTIIASSTKKNSSNSDNKTNIDIVVQKAKAIAQSSGVYTIRDYYLIAQKKEEILSDDKKAHTGSIIQYTIQLSLGGAKEGKSITNITIKDPLKKPLEYIPGTLKLNSKSLTDQKDEDEGYVNNNTIIVYLKSLSNQQNAFITFNAVIK